MKEIRWGYHKLHFKSVVLKNSTRIEKYTNTKLRAH